MNTIEELAAHIKAEGHLPSYDHKALLEKLKTNYVTFIVDIEKEDHDTQAAFHLMSQSTFHGKQLTPEEKAQIGNQMKDVLKTVDLIALTILPGGTVFFILAGVLHLNKYIIPSAFLKKAE
jgi:hypothetical protein